MRPRARSTSGLSLVVAFFLIATIPRLSIGGLFGTDPTIEDINLKLAHLTDKDASPKRGKLLLELGTLYYKKGQCTEAVSNFEKALLNPLSSESQRDLYLYLGKCESSLNRLDKAIEADEKLVDLDPRNWKRQRDLGLVYEQVNLLDKAFDSYKEALRLHGVEPSVYYDAGRVCRKMLLFEKAEGYLRKADQKGYKSIDLEKEWISIYEGEGRFQGAASRLSRMLGPSSSIQEWGRLLYLALLGGDKNLSQTALDQLKSRPEAKDSLPFYKEMAGLFVATPDEALFTRPQDPALQKQLNEVVENSNP